MRWVLMLLVGLWGATAVAQAPVVVVLIGEARDNAELSAVIAELLLRQNVEAQVESRERFEPEVWLDESSADERSFAFVSVRDRHRAQLYFRGPHGRRFLLRELTLRAGLDEVGRELIARVVETSTVALMSSSEGVTRDEARAELALATEAQTQPAPAPPPSVPVEQPKQAAPREPERRWNMLLGVRALGQWTGADLGARIGLGLEAGARFRTAGWLRIGGRLSAELALPQQLEAEGVDASVLAVPLRIGVDVGSDLGLFFGLSTGVDIEQLSPERTADSELMLARASTELTPTSRAELRYELALSRSLYLALSALIDVPWTAAHYDVQQDGTLKHLATPWRVQPGAVITLGATP